MAENDGQATGKKTSKFLLIIIVVVALAFALGGAAAYFFLGGHLQPVTPSGQAQDVSMQSKKPAETFYYDIAKPLIVDFPNGYSVRLIQISLSFLVGGEETLEVLKKHEPMIRNNLLMLISGQVPDELNSREGKEKLRSEIKAEVGAILEKMAGENHIREVFFTSFVMQ
ncbi:MAG: flagellar basal body-associated FliL family protein [Gammaproteobacteria bacterium]